MKTISLALYAEGKTDYSFLTIILQRVVENILYANRSPDIGVGEPTSINIAKNENLAKKMYEAAKEAQGAHILFIHLDADNQTPVQAKADRFYPGVNLIQSSKEAVCQEILAVIPVKNIEAWLTCDYETFKEVVGTHATAEELGLPIHPKLVESLPDPKRTFQEALRVAHSSRRRKRTDYIEGEYYELLARSIRLDNLLKVPAFNKFYSETTDILKKIKMIG